MRFLIKTLVGLVAVVIIVLAIAIGAVWMTVPLNVPWKSMLQQMSLLPAWLDPPPISADQVNGSLIATDGYGVTLFATGVPDARGLRVTARGDVVVSIPRDGRVILLSADDDGDGVSDGRAVLLEGLTRPNGLDFDDEHLYVAEEDGVGRVGFDVERGSTKGNYHRIIEGLPPGGNHWKKTLRVGPDGLLYVTVGSSCNVCVEEDPRRAAMLRYTRDGTLVDTYATGLRNSAGFDWSLTGSLYATDNGRDLLGDDFPPCELNRVVEGGFYGWPYANGNKIPDPDLGSGRASLIETSLAPVHEFRAHNAPLGMVFLRHPRHPPAYQGAAVVALHGSWNRSTKDGYKVVSLHFGANGSVEERDFLTGFLIRDEAIGRPVDVAEGPDGSIYISDDFASAVYRVQVGQEATLAVSSPTLGDTHPRYDPSAAATDLRDRALADGPSVFSREGCEACHALGADGDPPQVPLSNLRERYTVDELAEYLSRPQSPMPPYEADPIERRQLAIYLLEEY